MLRRPGRFGELLERQLDVFATDQADLLHEASAADDAWSRSPREETETRFGEYQLIVDALADSLYDVRETYASTLDQETAEAYRSAFNRAATKRFRRLAALLGE